MADVRIPKATVERIFSNGKGVAIVETFQARGEEFKRRYTCWFDAPPTLSVGDTARFFGQLSWKLRSYEKDGETKSAVDVALNSVAFDQLVQATVSAEADGWGGQQQGGWN